MWHDCPGVNGNAMAVRVYPSVGAIDRDRWNALAGAGNPFLSHEFLTALEDSGSVGPGTGWRPAPLAIEDGDGALLAAMPAYAKGHSQGEYVFDHVWAEAFERVGGDYYPKLQIAVPFTPVSGPRLLLSDKIYAAPLLQAAERLCMGSGFSSAHATFVEHSQVDLFEQAGWLLRSDLQFHWENRDYRDFDAFLADLASRKRKAIRKERAMAQDGISIVRLSGEDILPEHWDAFWTFYQDTGARKWGVPYLTREAFDMLGERMGENILLVFAYDDGEPIAGAMNVVGAETVYGRYWGCMVDRRFLHFELCYYQAIDFAIEHGLKCVEAGAQGGHKLARGYEPVETVSAHWIADPGFRSAVADFLERERKGVRGDRLFLAGRTPFKQSLS